MSAMPVSSAMAIGKNRLCLEGRLVIEFRFIFLTVGRARYYMRPSFLCVMSVMAARFVLPLLKLSCLRAPHVLYLGGSSNP